MWSRLCFSGKHVWMRLLRMGQVRCRLRCAVAKNAWWLALSHHSCSVSSNLTNHSKWCVCFWRILVQLEALIKNWTNISFITSDIAQTVDSVELELKWETNVMSEIKCVFWEMFSLSFFLHDNLKCQVVLIIYHCAAAHPSPFSRHHPHYPKHRYLCLYTADQVW